MADTFFGFDASINVSILVIREGLRWFGALFHAMRPSDILAIFLLFLLIIRFLVQLCYIFGIH